MKLKKLAVALAAISIIGTAALPAAENLPVFPGIVVSAKSTTKKTTKKTTKTTKTTAKATVLRKNATGAAVKKLQNNLITLNFLKSGSASGTYDTATQNAVKNLQSEYNLVADGVAGSATLNLVSSLIDGTAHVLKVEKDLVNVREGAGVDHAKITTVSGGQKFLYTNVKVNKSNNKWYQIVMGSRTGYISGDCISLVTQVSRESEVKEATGKLKVTGTTLNVRADTTTSSEKLALLKQGQVVEYSKTKTVSGEGWYFVKVSDAVSGWIMSKFVTPVTDTGTNTNTTVSSSGKLKVVGTLVNVRASASTSSKKVTAVKKGQTYEYTKVKTAGGNTWYFIKVNSKKSGWILGSLVSFTANGNTTSPSASGKIRITGTIVNVRETADNEGKKVASVKQGQTYTYSEVKKISGINWYHIQIDDSTSGWVMGSFVDFIPNGNSTTPASSGKLTITGSLLNVRADASTSSKVVTTVKVGQTFSYSKVKNVSKVNWYYIKVNDKKSGWVSGNYVNVEASASTTDGSQSKPTTSSAAETTTTQAETTTTATQKTTTDVPDSGKLKVNTPVLNVRADASSSADILTTISMGQEYDYDKISSLTWYRIKINDNTYGWVMGTYVLPEAAEQQTPAQSKTGSLKINGSSVNVRKDADTKYDVIGTVKRDQTFRYTDVKNGWFFIKVSDRVSGWISGKYVVTTPDEPGSTAVSPATSSATPSTTSPSSATETSATVASTTTEATTTEATTTESTTTEASSAQTTITQPVTRKVTVGTVNTKASALNVRKGSGTGYTIIGQLKKGSTVVILAKGSKWHKIEYGNGVGYVSAEFIKDIRTTTETVTSAYPNSYYCINVNDTLDLKLSVNGYTVTYKSSDPAVCPVSSKGVVSAYGEGLYTITAQFGSHTASTCVIVMKKPNADVQPMKISAEGTKFISDWEGGGTVLGTGETVYYPYQDVSGFWTIGYGHAKTTTASKSWSEERAIAEFNADIEAMIGEEYKLTDDRPYLTQEGANKLLNADLNDGDYVKAVSDWAVRNGVQLNQQQFDALCSFCYNIGTALWTSDSYLFYLKGAIISYRSGSDAVPDQVIEGFCRYMNSCGKAYKGLWYRRRNEAELFLKGDYALDRENKFTLPANVDWA